MSDEKKPREIIRYIVFVLFKKKWLIATIFFFTLFSFAFGTYLVTPQWEATAKIIVLPNPRQQTMLFKNLAAPPLSAKATSAYDIVEMLTSNEFGMEIVKQFGLDERLRQKVENPQTLRDKIKLFIIEVLTSPITLATKLGNLPEGKANFPDKALEDLIEDMEDIELTEGTSTIDLSIWAESPDLAVGIANSLAAMAVEKTKRFEQTEADESYQNLNTQLKSVEESLQSAEDELVRFKEQNQIVDLATEKNIKLKRLDTIKAEADATQKDLLALKAKLQMLQKELSTQPEVLTTSEIIGVNIMHTRLRDSLSEAEIELATKRETLKPEHPDIRALKAQIKETKLKLQQEEERMLQNETSTPNPIHQDLSKRTIEFEALISELTSKSQSLRKMLTEINLEMDTIAQKEIMLQRLYRLVNGFKNRYVTLRDKLLELEVQRYTTFSEYDIKISDPAHILEDVKPDWPIWPLNLIVGVLFGLILGIGMAFFGGYWSDSLEIPEDVEKEAGLKVFGTIPSFAVKSVIKQLRC